MSTRYDAIVIGGGVNGLSAAALLGKAGKRTLLLERREGLGGLARGTEFAPGFRSAPLGLDAGWLPPAVASGLGLNPPERVLPELPLAVAAGEGDWLLLHRELPRAAEAIRRYSAADARAWPAFAERLARYGAVLGRLYTRPAPELPNPSARELLPLLGWLGQLRGLGRRELSELLRVLPMAIQELLDDSFEAAPLKAGIAAVACGEHRQGPRSGGTAFALLHRQAGAAPGAIGEHGYWKAGPEALSEALTLLARGNGVELRTAADVVRIVIEQDRAVGVVLASGESLASRAVFSSADPARTLLGLVDPVWLDPEFLLAVRNIRFRGSSAFVSYALDGLPEFPGLGDGPRALAGMLCLTGSLERLERAADAAKYGRVSEHLHLRLSVPSLRWPGLAPAGKHVLVARAQWAPYALRDAAWTEARRSQLGEQVTAAIAEQAPGFPALVLHREVLAPPDVERRYGCTEGAPCQGEMALDQILFMRPVPGASRYRTPLAGLYLAGAGCHPGHGIAAAPGWLAARQALAESLRN